MNVEIKRAGLTLKGLYENVSDSIVILSHGFTSNYHYYAHLAPVLNKAGFSTLRFDFNGHGHSDGRQEDMTVTNEVEDLIAVIHYVQELGYKKIYLLGQSQGGVVSSMVAGYYHELIKGLVLMAPAAVLKEDAINGTLMGKTYDPQNIPEVIDTGWYKVGGQYFRIAQTLPIFETAKQYKGPVCLVHGDADQIVPVRISKQYDEGYENSELHIIPGENHNFSIHEEVAFDYIVSFLTRIKE